MSQNEGGASLMEKVGGKTLTFWVNHELFGIPITHVIQIIGMQEIHAVPDFPSYAKGIINLRGSVVPVIDMRLRLGMQGVDYTDRSCILITSIQGCIIGLLVEEIDEVLDFGKKEIDAMPNVVGGAHRKYLSGVGKKGNKLILLVDVDQFFSEEQLRLLQNSMN